MDRQLTTLEVPVEVLRAATGRPGAVAAEVARRPAVARVENMTTEAIDRVGGTLGDGTAFSVIAKTLRPASDAPEWAFIPEANQAEVLEALNWLDEPRVYRSGLAGGLPAGFRMPRLYGADHGPARITLWLEDVADQGAWTLDRYRRTARCLGAMGGRWPAARAAGELGMGERDLAPLFFGKICHLDLPLQSDDGFWAHPAVAGAADGRHRQDLFRLAELMPGFLGRLGTLPAGLCHGDASPGNFLEPGDGTVVGIDWSYAHAGALGSDLGQLLAGRFDSGEADPDDLDAIAAAVLDGYADGLAAEGTAADAPALEAALAVHLATRSVFSALVVEPGPDPVAHESLLRRRAALGRFGLDLALRLAGGR